LASYLLQSSFSKPIQSVLDVGCGICGPARNISRFLNIDVTGISINDYQVQRGNELNAKDVTSNVKAVQGDFMNMPFTEQQFDAAYAIEATCHAPDRVQCYSEIARVIAPGGVFACYEWCLTDKYDPNNETHRKLKADIEIGNGLPDIATTHECLKAMEQAGYEILYETDLAATSHVQPWMTPLTPSWNPLTQRFQFNPVGAVITNFTIALLEFLRLAPAGTVQTQQVLQTGGFALAKAGQAGIFTTMYLMVGRKN
jgi:sterol 24-C-methyltransferase